MKNNLPSSLAMAITLYNFTVDSHTLMIVDSHRRANEDHPKAQECRNMFLNNKMIFEVATGISWDHAFEYMGERTNWEKFERYLNEDY